MVTLAYEQLLGDALVYRNMMELQEIIKY